MFFHAFLDLPGRAFVSGVVSSSACYTCGGFAYHVSVGHWDDLSSTGVGQKGLAAAGTLLRGREKGGEVPSHSLYQDAPWPLFATVRRSTLRTKRRQKSVQRGCFLSSVATGSRRGGEEKRHESQTKELSVREMFVCMYVEGVSRLSRNLRRPELLGPTRVLKVPCKAWRLFHCSVL